ncbi:MAG: SAM-dependent methyltransferase [Thermoanaerobaculia bacterium]
MKETGSLLFVGTGMLIAGQVTQEALSAIESAEKLYYLVTDIVTSRWLESLNPTAESLYGCYADGKPREQTYAEMVDRLLSSVREGRQVVAALYGHPGIFVAPSHEAIRQARAEGFDAQMMPGISAEDCLFADLGIDPGERGCQSFEATDFLLRRRIFDPTSTLILWQIGGIGVFDFHQTDLWSRSGLAVLATELLRHYPADHEIVVYEAVPYPTLPQKIDRLPLSVLAQAAVTIRSTLYVPPLPDRETDLAMRALLRLPSQKPGPPRS